MDLQKLQKTIFFITVPFSILAVILFIIVSNSHKPSEIHFSNAIRQYDQVVVDLSPANLLGIGSSNSQLNVYEPGDFVLRLPDAAMLAEYNAALTWLDPVQLESPGESSWRHVIVVNLKLTDGNGIAYDTVRFSKPVEACFVLNETQLSAYMEDRNRFRVEHFNDQVSPAQWEVLPIASYLIRGMVCGQSSTGSMFALSEQMESLVPVTAFGGTTISPNDTSTRTFINTSHSTTTTPSKTPTRTTLAPTNTSSPSRNAPFVPTGTPIPPSNPRIPATSTPPPSLTNTVSPTGTSALSTDTEIPPTDTAIPPTGTSVSPTDTSAPPTNTSAPPTDTAVPATKTPKPSPIQPTRKPTKS